MLIFSTSLFLVVSGALIQNSHFVLWGVKPNIVLTAIVAAAIFEKDWLRRSIVVLLGASLLALEPSFGFETLFALAIFFLALALVDFLPWQRLPNGLVAIAIASLAINLNGFQLGVFTIELIYNLILFLLLFALFESWSTKRV